MGELYTLNFPNGKAYIGIASNGAMGRFLEHRRHALKRDNLLYNAWRKHGEPRLQVLAIIEDDLLHETEIKAIAAYGTMLPNGYNMTLGGEGTFGRIPSPETRAKISAANSNYSPERRAKISAANSNPSPETRAKMSAAKKGRVVSPETRAKMSAAGRNQSQEHRAAVSSANRRRVFSVETRAKMSAALKGKVFSPETRAKLRAASKQRWDTHRVEMKKVQP